MSKKLTIEEVASRSGLPKKTVEIVLDHLADATEHNLKAGQEVILPGVGKLSTKDMPSRMGRNPKTGEIVPVPAHRKIKFVVAGTLKKAVAA